MMDFFDCNVAYGLPSRRPLLPVASAAQLQAEMTRAGVGKTLVWQIIQHDASPQADPHHAMGVLLSAEISDEDRHNICHRNAQHLLAPFIGQP